MKPRTLFYENKTATTTLFFVTGWNVAIHNVDQFATDLSKKYSVFATETRTLGVLTTANTLVQDLISQDKELRKKTKNKIVYIGHSFAFPLMVEAARRHGRKVEAFIALGSYPKLDFFSNWFALLNWYTPGQFPVMNHPPSQPLLFIHGMQDGLFPLTNTTKIKFRQWLQTLPHATLKIIRGNHWFNHTPRKMFPFNGDKPKSLLKTISSFIESIQ